MANKTVEKISPDTFWDEIKAINNKAKEAAIDLLNKQGDNRYIVVMDWEDYYTEYYTNQAAISVSVFGVGLNEDNNLCIAATVDNQGYGCSKNDFEQDWVEVSELFRPCYALLYGFVANNIDKAVTKEEADRLAKKYWNEMDMTTASMTGKMTLKMVLLRLSLTERQDSLMKTVKRSYLANTMVLGISLKDW